MHIEIGIHRDPNVTSAPGTLTLRRTDPFYDPEWDRLIRKIGGADGGNS